MRELKDILNEKETHPERQKLEDRNKK